MTTKGPLTRLAHLLGHRAGKCSKCAVIDSAVVNTDSGWLDLSHCLNSSGYYTVVCSACAERMDAEWAKEFEGELA